MWRVVGQDRVVSLLQRSLEAGSLAHAYLLVGPSHVGKMTLALNLAHLLSTQQISTHPWPRTWPLDYQVIVYVWRFDADENGRVVLRAHWMVQDKTGKHIIAQRLADISETVPAGDFEAIAAAQSKALAELSRDIAEAIPTKRR